MSQGRNSVNFNPDQTQAYLYRNPARPPFSTKWGYGNKPNNRVDLRPTGKRIIVDGTTLTNAPYYRVADMVAAKAIFAKGDWILFPGGGTTTIPWNELKNGTVFMGGTSLQNLGVIGTFDLAHNTQNVADEAFYNTQRFQLDMRGQGHNSAPWSYLSSGTDPAANMAIVNIDVIADNTDCGTAIDYFGPGGGLLFECCTFNGIIMRIQGTAGNQAVIGTSYVPITSITSSGTTATALTAKTTYLTVGKYVGVDNGANGSTGSGTIVTSLTSSGTTATALTANTVGLSVGGKVRVAMANETPYNGVFTITAITPNASFSYTMGSTAVTPATFNGTFYNYFIWTNVYTGLYPITAVNPGVSFNYTFPGNNNVAASGGSALVYALPTADLPTNFWITDVEFRFCGMSYGSDAKSGHGGNVYLAYVDNYTFSGSIDFFGGWSKGSNRLTPEFPGFVGGIQSITSTGTLATALSNNTGTLAIGDFAVIEGAGLSPYNGTYRISALTANVSFQYTMRATAVSPAASPSGIGWQYWTQVEIAVSGLSSSGLTATALTANTAGLYNGAFVSIRGANEGAYNGLAQISSLVANTSFQYPLQNAAVTPATGTIGWQGPYLSGVGVAITSMTRSGTVATVLTGNTYTLAKNDNISIAGAIQPEYNGFQTITGLVPNVSFTFTVAGTPATPATGVPRWGAWDAIPGRGPDTYAHGHYTDDSCKRLEFFDSIIAFDVSNPKITGAAITMWNVVCWRCPMAPILAGSANNTWSNPGGMDVNIRNFLQVFSSDFNDVYGPRGWGLSVNFPKPGSYIQAVMLNNDSFSTINRSGIDVKSNAVNGGTAYAGSGSVTIDQTIIGNWPNPNTLTAPDPLTAVINTNNTWTAPSQAGGNVINTSMPVNYQARLAAALNLDIFTFLNAYPAYFSAVQRVTDAGTLTANRRQTEVKAFEYMCANMIPNGQNQTPVPWAAMMQQHFQSAFSGS